MPRGYRRIILVAVGLILAASSPQSDRNTQERNTSDEIAPPSKPTAPPPGEPVKQSQAPELDRPCQPGEENHKSDLCAQWKAADAAADAAYWAMLSFFLGIAGTFGLFWTLFYTREAVKAARDATKDSEHALAIAERNAVAAGEQVRISEETAKRQLRAYIGAEKFKFIKNTANLSNPFWQPEVQWINTGSTPAYNLKQAICWRFFSNGQVPNNFDFYADPAEGTVTLAPRQSETGIGPVIFLDSLLDANKNGEALLVWGWAEYSDIFPATPRRRTEFAFEVNVKSNFEFEFIALNRHNGMDLNCFRQANEWRGEPQDPAGDYRHRD